MAKITQNKPYPNKKTLWSYAMQAIEPHSKAINEAFPGYHPMWIVQSQKMTVNGQQFKYLRETLLGIDLDQCAAYLRIHKSTIRKWEANQLKVSFVAFELLRVVYESTQFRLSNKDWQGWFVSTDGRLVSPDRGSLSFSPADLSYVREIHQQKSFFEAEFNRMLSEIEPLKAELESLRNSVDENHVLKELQAIESRLADIAQKVSATKVIKLSAQRKKNENEVKKCA